MAKHRVLVIGFGPAGAAVSIFLAQEGFNVIAVDPRPATGLKAGESLPPDAGALLMQLGVWDAFQEGSHEKCFGNRAYWRSEVPHFHDFMLHPTGHGWHIDRVEFEDMLRTKAIGLGVNARMGATVSSLKREDGVWKATLSNPAQDRKTNSATEETFDCAFAVDASGRGSWLARRQGVERLCEDRRLALIAFLKMANPFEDSATLVETTSEGWWYSSRIPGARAATAFFCQPDRTQQSEWATESGWRRLIEQAKHTWDRLAPCDFGLIEPPRFITADSGILEKMHGDGWLAVGDAAMTYDPIASHGLTMGMVGARDATEAIRNALAGDNEALQRYEGRMREAFIAYSELRRGFYPEQS